MATVMLMHWREATPERYDQVREKVSWDTDVPAGVKLHICGFADDGMHILDVRESQQAFNACFEQRLGLRWSGLACRGSPM